MSRVGRAALFAAPVYALPALAAAQANPGADHPVMLRKLIVDAAAGHIDYASLAPSLADAVRPQAATAQAELSALGALKSVSLSSTAPDGVEIYRTAFEKGDLDWAFHVDVQGRIDNAIYRKAKPAQP